MRQYKELIEGLALPKITVMNVEEHDDCDVITIKGGFNGRGDLCTYLEQVARIVANLELKFHTNWDIWLINWENDCLDDIWYLKIGIRK